MYRPSARTIFFVIISFAILINGIWDSYEFFRVKPVTSILYVLFILSFSHIISYIVKYIYKLAKIEVIENEGDLSSNILRWFFAVFFVFLSVCYLILPNYIGFVFMLLAGIITNPLSDAIIEEKLKCEVNYILRTIVVVCFIYISFYFAK